MSKILKVLSKIVPASQIKCNITPPYMIEIICAWWGIFSVHITESAHTICLSNLTLNLKPTLNYLVTL